MKKCDECVTALHCESAGGCLQYMTADEYRSKTASANERAAFERLSMALSKGNAGTWDEVFHAAETRSIETCLAQALDSGLWEQDYDLAKRIETFLATVNK